MKIERIKNAKRNIAFGMIQNIYQVVMPFVMRTIMLYVMGVEYLGLNSLFTSVLQVLNLAELGVASAMVYSMYKPIAEDDTQTICALMRLYRKYYRIIGLVIAVLGLILLPFLPYLIKDGLPDDVNLYVLYLLNLAGSVLSYWLFAYRNSLFLAHQRVDMTSKISLFANTLQYVLQISLLFIFENYYLYLIVAILIKALNNIITAVFAKKHYPYYDPVGQLEEEKVKSINQRIRDLFTSKIGAVIVNSADSIVISAFLGLTVLAVYQNYFFILTAVIGIVGIIFSACTAGVGNSIIVETKEKNFNDLNKFTFIIAWIAGFCSCCLLCLYQPFISLWVGEELLLKMSAVVCFCVYYFVYEINQVLLTYKDAAGIWHEDRFRPLATALSNLAMNLLLVQFWGIYGVLLSTVLSMLFVGMPWLLHNLFTILFDKSQLKQYLINMITYSFVSVLVCALCYFVCSFINMSHIVTLILRGAVCLVIPNVIFLVAYRKRTEYKQSLQILDKVTKGKLKLVKRPK